MKKKEKKSYPTIPTTPSIDKKAIIEEALLETGRELGDKQTDGTDYGLKPNNRLVGHRVKSTVRHSKCTGPQCEDAFKKPS
jgi:hypothetical protein